MNSTHTEFPVMQRLTELVTRYREEADAQAQAEEEREREIEQQRRISVAARVVTAAEAHVDAPWFADVLAPAIEGQRWTGYPDLGDGWDAEACAVLFIADGVWLRYGESPRHGLGTTVADLELITATAFGYETTSLVADSSVVSALEKMHATWNELASYRTGGGARTVVRRSTFDASWSCEGCKRGGVARPGGPIELFEVYQIVCAAEEHARYCDL